MLTTVKAAFWVLSTFYGTADIAGSGSQVAGVQDWQTTGVQDRRTTVVQDRPVRPDVLLHPDTLPPLHTLREEDITLVHSTFEDDIITVTLKNGTVYTYQQADWDLEDRNPATQNGRHVVCHYKQAVKLNW